MLIISEIIDIVGLVFFDAFSNAVLFPILILAFLAVIPCLIRYLCFRK